MKKRLIIIAVSIFAVLLVGVITILVYLNFQRNIKSEHSVVDQCKPVDFTDWKNGTLIVNGKVCENATVRIHPDGYAVIPILRIAEELGGTVKWRNKDVAIIKYNATKFTLNTKEKTLVESGMNYSVFDALCGKTNGVPYFEKEGDDFVVADEWAGIFISDINAIKHIDSEENIVYIDTKSLET